MEWILNCYFNNHYYRYYNCACSIPSYYKRGAYNINIRNYIDKRPIKEPYMKELKSIADVEDSCCR